MHKLFFFLHNCKQKITLLLLLAGRTVGHIEVFVKEMLCYGCCEECFFKFFSLYRSFMLLSFLATRVSTQSVQTLSDYASAEPLWADPEGPDPLKNTNK